MAADTTTKGATPLPLIVGFGGYNAAGRSSFHQGFRRMVLESLSEDEQRKTVVGLACLMGLVRYIDGDYLDADNKLLSPAEVDANFRQQVLDGTLIRRIEAFDPSFVPSHKRISFENSQPGAMCFRMAKRDLPHLLPDSWKLEELADGQVQITTDEKTSYLVESHYSLAAQAAGQLPSGLNPADHYNSRFHPRGLQMTLLGASDALHSVGIPIDKLVNSVSPDQIGVYASSVVGQLAEEGMAGVLQARLKGGRITAKQLPLGLNTMPADFINAYVLGSVGHTEAITGACATFLYLLQAAVRDITSGKRRIAVLGNAEAVVVPEVMEGFIAMSALGNDENICKLDETDTPNWRRASRPFGYNCGFTMAEAAQFLVLMDDALAIELGADIHGAVPAVYINADGVKKSISAPGAGNYICFAKAVAAASQLLGSETVKTQSFVHAHGSSTPANRTTESDLINRIAEAFDIRDWPVTAVKAFVGHSLSAASGDQVISALGTFKHQVIPGIKTINEVAHDVNQRYAKFPLKDIDTADNPMQVCFVNSKGFGGNNATAIVVSPEKTEQLLTKRYGAGLTSYRERREGVRKTAAEYEFKADTALLDVIYRFGDNPINDSEIVINENEVVVPGFEHPVALAGLNPWAELSD